ncbi:MAG: tetratricopeptide repeat protein, partial [Anaerolineae bacterium]
MSGNREALERLMQAAANAAWDGKWEEAAEAYGQAVMEFPEDVDALTGLGIAYSSLGRSEEALGAYRRACDVEPYDAILRERVGRALEALGRTEEAASAYVTSGQQYEEHGAAAHLARARWEDAVRVHPACSRAHVSLLKQHQKTGRVRAAVKECLALARIYRDQERIGDAVRSCEHALELSPRNSQAVALLERLRREESPPMVQEAPQAPVRQVEGPKVPSVDVLSADALDFSLSTEEEPLAQEGNPVESTQRRALADLAESVFEGNDLSASESERLGKSAVDAIISKAIDFQTRGDTERAIAAYRQVLEAGASRPAVHFNLGVLYQDKRRFEDALTQFERAVAHPDYKLGSHFALGECYRARGLIEEALKHFVHVLKIVDLAMVEQEYSDDLADLYEHLINGYLVKGDQEQAL